MTREVRISRLTFYRAGDSSRIVPHGLLARTMQGVNMPTVTVNGFTMYYERAGDGDPLIYVHGGNISLLTLLRYGRRPFSWRWRQDFVDHFHFL